MRRPVSRFFRGPTIFENEPGQAINPDAEH